MNLHQTMSGKSHLANNIKEFWIMQFAIHSNPFTTSHNIGAKCAHIHVNWEKKTLTNKLTWNFDRHYVRHKSLLSETKQEGYSRWHSNYGFHWRVFMASPFGFSNGFLETIGYKHISDLIPHTYAKKIDSSKRATEDIYSEALILQFNNQLKEFRM